MRKSIITATLALAMFSSVSSAQNYQTATQDAQRQAWQNAAMGAAFNVGGMIIGSIANSLSPQAQAQPRQQQGYAPQGYAPAPPVVNPYYYPQAQACVTQRAPVYNSYGQVVEFQQYCANPAR
jgi:hypothetical protein